MILFKHDQTIMKLVKSDIFKKKCFPFEKEIEEIKVAPASNLLMPIKVSSKLGKIEAGHYPIHFEIEAYEEELGVKPVLRQRDEKSIFIIPR